MRSTFLLIIVVALFGCSDAGQQKAAKKEPAKYGCATKATFGDIEICMPVIDGMKECYAEPKVKARADNFNYEGNVILAFYINDETYKQVDKIDEITFDDYFHVYASNKLKGIKVSEKEWEEMGKLLEGNFLKENWGNLKEKIEKDHDYLSVGRPVLIESYSPNDRAKTFVMLTKYLVDKKESVLLITMNMLKIKDRVISMAYYKNYDGEESVKAAKSKNDYIVLRLLDEN